MLVLNVLTTLGQLSMLIMMGIYFIFSCTVMRALRQSEQGAEIMVLINREILNPLFYLCFFGSAVASLTFVLSRSNHYLAGLIFFIGTFMVTLIKNVPLNNALLEASGDASLQHTWQTYLTKWLFWNHVRSVTAIVSGALLLWPAA
ncbi:DUF1772 domain-containing protein [Aestuariibacter sp. GS-14]|uniref:anthrone oxygenase family protein n=1 Tax=Aestuariibacter sp. GS-14 TaxID=2590670 RepID=UPI0011266089|nr:anthrone oxygenase family protein [Aestuariibacter sp. GS-14]TPV62248.1 DUF1772 domain-containing protein [Aestuariibacter sp. GS-14]